MEIDAKLKQELDKLNAKWTAKDSLHRWSTYHVDGNIVIKRGVV